MVVSNANVDGILIHQRMAIHSWQEQTLAYYAGASVECVEPEELDEDERLARRRAYLEKEFGSVE